MLKEIRILGIKVHIVNMDETISIISNWIKESGHRQVVTVGTEMVMAAQKNKELACAINNADLVVPDTSGILWAGQCFGVKLKEKVTGVDLIYYLSSLASKEGWEIFLLGGNPGIAETAANKLCQRYPSLPIAGTMHGYFDDDKSIIQKIKPASPKILFVAIGSPKQELWLSKNLALTGATIGIGVGGSFDVTAGVLKRAPKWMIRCHLEWLFRLIQEPSRWKRMLVLPHFAAKVLLERLKNSCVHKS